MNAALKLQPESFIENKGIRNEYINKTEVLDKVKNIIVLPDKVHIESKEVANYYDVDVSTIRQVRNRHKEELDQDGVVTMAGIEFKDYKQNIALHGVTLSAKSNITLFTRKAMLRIGMLLKDSEVAVKVRDYLLKVEAVVPDEVKNEILGNWSDGDLLLIEQTINEESNKGNSKMGALRLAAKKLNRNANNVQQKYYQIKKKYGSLRNYLVEKNVIYLNAPEYIVNPIQSLDEQQQPDIVQSLVGEFEKAMRIVREDSNLQSQINELKLEVNDLKNQLKLKEVLIEGKDAQLNNKTKLNSKLKKEKSVLEHKLKFISQILNSSKVVDNTQVEMQETKKYVIKNGVIETK
ncbi:hypothetical protein [Paenibacillus sp. USHLN196]|uniref:hypothetical protein n=1 Tax=Paenibacillus sp. USHLN196 TaxID=3081291 RepID=UPI003018CB10